jgi:caffeoyl-CoA O-methyltransferase
MKGTPLTEATYNYIVDNFAFEEEALLEMMQTRAHAAGVPMIMISPEQAKFVGFFLRAMKAKRVLDIGTLFGYSAAIMAKAVGEDGEVVTLEFEAAHAAVALSNFRHAGLSNVSLLQGPALDHMKSMPDNYFDFIIIDADKINYRNYLRESLRLIKNGGVIAGDNAFAFGFLTDETLTSDSPDYIGVTAIREFNKEFAQLDNVFSAVVPVGDGMVMGVVRKK